MSFSPIVDSKSVFVESIKDEPYFSDSVRIYKNDKPIRGVLALEELECDMLDFASNPELGLQHMPKRPAQPNVEGLTKEEADERMNEYIQQIDTYNKSATAYQMHVSPADFDKIQQYKKRFERALSSTSSIKGKRASQILKDIPDPQGGGILSSFRRQNNSPPQ